LQFLFFLWAYMKICEIARDAFILCDICNFSLAKFCVIDERFESRLCKSFTCFVKCNFLLVLTACTIVKFTHGLVDSTITILNSFILFDDKITITNALLSVIFPELCD
jgi:hypothetical protein